jgi:hypothetical protein
MDAFIVKDGIILQKMSFRHLMRVVQRKNPGVKNFATLSPLRDSPTKFVYSRF